MKWNEYHHAWIVSEFYRLFTAQWRERGTAAFIQAAQTYGEQRGKRMAMRAIADGQPLDFVSYFAYGEYDSTEEFFDVSMWGEPGVVNEQVTRCPWADLFARRGLKECGRIYCREIDRAIVRGFNPELILETVSTQHFEDCCRFYFRDAGMASDALEQADVRGAAAGADPKLPMSYHCAHVFHAYAAAARGVFGADGERVTEEVLAGFAAEYGPEAAEELAERGSGSFETIVSKKEWADGDKTEECV